MTDFVSILDAGTSRPASWFFQLYNVGLLTPSF
jgi:hypothetical protein